MYHNKSEMSNFTFISPTDWDGNKMKMMMTTTMICHTFSLDKNAPESCFINGKYSYLHGCNHSQTCKL